MKTMQQTYKPILKLYWLGHTTLAIVHSVEKPHIFMTIVILIFGLVFAVYLMRLAFLNFGKEKYPTSTLLAVLAVVAFCFSIDTNRVLIQDLGDEVKRVFFITSFVPVNNSIHGIYSGGGMFAQTPMLPIRQPLSRNVLMTHFKGAAKPEEMTFHFQYVKTAHQTNLFKSFLAGKSSLDDLVLEDSGPPSLVPTGVSAPDQR